MTTLRTAAQQALEALEWHYRQGHSNTFGGFRLKIDEKALRNLRAALAQHPDTDCHTQGICQRSGYSITQQAEPVEPVKHKHQWFSTGAMEPGEMRCIQCGAWAKEKNT
jgi:hypothetical protein